MQLFMQRNEPLLYLICGKLILETQAVIHPPACVFRLWFILCQSLTRPPAPMTFSRTADPNLHDRQMHSWAMWVMGRPTCTLQAPGFPVGLPRWSLSSELNGGAAYSNYITCQPAAPSYCLLKINAFSPTPKLHHSRHLTGFVQWQGQQLSCSTEWLKTQWHFTYNMTRVRRDD